MARRVIVALTVAMLPATVRVMTADPVTGTPCANLAALTIPGVTIRSSTALAAGPFTPPNAQNAFTLPAFCRVEATARPTSDSEIRFEVWIPSDIWNGKFEGVGNGGYSGAIGYTGMANALRRGYATASTDTGHTGDDMKFGQGHPEKIVDWAHRSIHVMTDAAKLIVRNHAGKLPARAYFNGCSTGGHQALSEAQRYPEDYDGIVAGDPANNRIRQTFAFLWAWMATHTREGQPMLAAAKLSIVTSAAIAACDANDGVKDGVIDDPRRCRFNPATLLCKPAAGAASTDESSCLTQPQVDAVQKMYDGVKNPRTGETIFAGWPRGSESFGESAIEGWRAYVLDPAEPSRAGFFRYFLFHDPNWDDVRTVDFDRDLAYAEQKLPFMAAVDRDLTAFKKRGGKLLMYTGWSDPAVPPQDTASYYDAVVKTMGGLEKTREFFRFFTAPGMGHCGGGPGPNQFDALGALEQWVEHGIAPEKLIASHQTNGRIDRTRPLCPYPLVARWKGDGSTDEAANFACVAAPASRRPTSQLGQR